MKGSALMVLDAEKFDTGVIELLGAINHSISCSVSPLPIHAASMRCAIIDELSKQFGEKFVVGNAYKNNLGLPGEYIDGL
jgi:hypothetical protein